MEIKYTVLLTEIGEIRALIDQYGGRLFMYDFVGDDKRLIGAEFVTAENLDKFNDRYYKYRIGKELQKEHDAR